MREPSVPLEKNGRAGPCGGRAFKTTAGAVHRGPRRPRQTDRFHLPGRDAARVEAGHPRRAKCVLLKSTRLNKGNRRFYILHKRLFLFSQTVELQDGIRKAYTVHSACCPLCPRAPGCTRLSARVPGWTPSASGHVTLSLSLSLSLHHAPGPATEASGLSPSAQPAEAWPKQPPQHLLKPRPSVPGMEEETQEGNVLSQGCRVLDRVLKIQAAVCFSLSIGPTRRTLASKN